VSAADYGVPQRRRRLIIIGMREGEFWFPKPTHGSEGVFPYVASNTVVDKHRPLGEPPDCPVVYAKYPDPRRSPYAGHVYNGGGRPLDLAGPCHTILASAGGYKTHWVDTQDIAPGYTAHLMAGGMPRDGTVPGARRLTIEESALLQTFPPEMEFAGSRSSQYTQVGDAVPPVLARVLGEALRNQLSRGTASPDTHYRSHSALPLFTETKMSDRNVHVEITVNQIIKRVDAFLEGEKLTRLPSSDARKAMDAQLARGNSVRLASLFLAFYSTVDATWDKDSIPIGIRGQWGDKRLATQLNLRDITLHNAITAFGENLGWKGNVTKARLLGDERFEAFAQTLGSITPENRLLAADYMASRFAESRRTLAPLPPVSDDVLTFARARLLFHSLVSVPSEGNIQQFLVAALLHVHRARYGHEVRTHHVHASDKFDTTAGDIEEFRDGDLLRAYEVTVRPDWKNRVTAFRAKMDAAKLRKYTIIASNVGSDEELAEPASMVKFLEPYGRDIAVVDIHDFLNVFAMELSADELREAVRQAHSYLTMPSLYGRADIIGRFSDCVVAWLDEST